MKKINQSATLGGAPIYKSDLRDIFNDEVWSVMEALFSPYDGDTEGMIVSGCVFSNNAGNFDMTAGIVYLNGEFMRISAVTNQTYTKYIAPKAAVNDTRTFADGTSQIVAITKEAEIVGSAPGSGQYITINSLTGAEDRRWTKPVLSTPSLKTKVLEIGDWDMDTNGGPVLVAHGLDRTKIRSVSVIVRNDNDDSSFQAPYPLNILPNYDPQIAFTIGATNISMLRNSGGNFDSTDFDQTSYNRGWITIIYEE